MTHSKTIPCSGAARGLISLALSITLLTASAALRAGTTCQETPLGTLCRSEVNFARFAQTAYQTQLASQWCWAASISMIFAYHGHPVAQPRIVSEVYGSPVNMPATAGYVMAQQLNKQWLDDRGERFDAHLSGVYDAYAGIYGVSNAQLIAELDRGNPVLYANRTHAVVLTALEYYRTPFGPNVIAGGVFDPWPGKGARPLTNEELIAADIGGAMTFVATANIDDVANPTPGPGGTGDEDHSGGTGALDYLFVAVLLGLAASGCIRRRLRAHQP